MTVKIKGTVQQATGKLQDVAGDVLGDPGLQIRGKARQLAGQAQRTYGDALDNVRDMTSDAPIVALAIAGVVGFVIGALWGRR